MKTKKELSMKEQRLYKRFSAKFHVKLEAAASSRMRVLYAKTKDISATGAFFCTKEASFIPDDTRFILNSSDLNNIRIKLKELKHLKDCSGTMVRSTSEGIAIRFDSPVELFV
jgi:c-di-GMP-binding flagellar brake protein YcgR